MRELKLPLRIIAARPSLAYYSHGRRVNNFPRRAVSLASGHRLPFFHAYDKPVYFAAHPCSPNLEPRAFVSTRKHRAPRLIKLGQRRIPPNCTSFNFLFSRIGTIDKLIASGQVPRYCSNTILAAPLSFVIRHATSSLRHNSIPLVLFCLFFSSRLFLLFFLSITIIVDYYRISIIVKYIYLIVNAWC